MAVLGLASSVFNKKKASEGKSSELIQITGTAVEPSENGYVKVIVDGSDVVLPDGVGYIYTKDGQPVGDISKSELDAGIANGTIANGSTSYITLPTTPSVKAGDKVTISATGGTSKTMEVSGNQGFGDRISTEIDKAEQDAAGASKAATAAAEKAANLATELDATNQKVEQTASDLEGVKTTVSNAVTKADESLTVATEAKQTATEASTKATSAYENADEALTQASTATQTATAVKTEVEQNYVSKTDAASTYATKSSVEQTASSLSSTITSVQKTANTANSTANAAKSAAATAQSTADTAKNNAAAAQSTADSAKSATETLKTSVSALEQDAESIAARVSTVEATASNAETLAKGGVSKVEVQYAQNQSTTTAPTSGWSTTAPTWKDGYYVWQKTVTTYKDGTTTESDPTCISGAKGATGATGATGAKGDKGDTGATGAAGADGVSYGENLLLAPHPRDTTGRLEFGSSDELRTVTFKGWDDYNSGGSQIGGTSIWKDSYALVDRDWNKRVGEKLTYKCYIDNTASDAYDKTGIMLHVRYADDTYQQYGGGWGGKDGQHISQYVPKGSKGWCQITITIPDPTTRSNPTTIVAIMASIRHAASATTAATVSYQYAKVELGETASAWSPAYADQVGNGVSSITPQYYLSTSATSCTGGSWSTTMPTPTDGKYIWTRSMVKYTDGTSVPTDAVLDTQYNSIVKRTASLETKTDSIEANVSEVKTTADSALTKATNVETTVDGVETTISTMQTDGLPFNPNLLPDSDASSLAADSAAYPRYFEQTSAAGYTCTFVEIDDPPVPTIKYGVKQVNTTSSASSPFHALCWYNGGLIYGKAGKKYTMSCYAKLTSGTAGKIRMQIGYTTYLQVDITLPADGKWHRISYTFTWPSTSETTQSNGGTRVYCGGLCCDGTAKTALICGYKLEEGEEATAYAPPTSSDTIIRQSGAGVEVARKVNGSYTSTRTTMSDSGVTISDKSGTALANFGTTATIGKTSGNNVYIDSDSVDIRNGSTVLSTFTKDAIELGKNSSDAAIYFGNGNMHISKGVIATSYGQSLQIDARTTHGSEFGQIYMHGTNRSKYTVDITAQNTEEGSQPCFSLHAGTNGKNLNEETVYSGFNFDDYPIYHNGIRQMRVAYISKTAAITDQYITILSASEITLLIGRTWNITTDTAVVTNGNANQGMYAMFPNMRSGGGLELRVFNCDTGIAIPSATTLRFNIALIYE